MPLVPRNKFVVQAALVKSRAHECYVSVGGRTSVGSTRRGSRQRPSSCRAAPPTPRPTFPSMIYRAEEWVSVRAVGGKGRRACFVSSPSQFRLHANDVGRSGMSGGECGHVLLERRSARCGRCHTARPREPDWPGPRECGRRRSPSSGCGCQGTRDKEHERQCRTASCLHQRRQRETPATRRAQHSVRAANCRVGIQRENLRAI